MNADMTEAQLLQTVRDLARMRHWLTYHTHRSDRSEPGFPDLVCVHRRTGELLFAELKSSKGRLSQPQQKWLDALTIGGHSAHVWKPSDLKTGAITRALTPADVRGAS